MERKRFHFDMEDIAKAFGLKYGTVKLYSHKGYYDPHNLKSICEFYAQVKANQDKRKQKKEKV
jgi:hypothetical protein